MLGTYHTQALLEALADLHHLHDLKTLHLFVLNRCGDFLKAQGGTFFTVNEKTQELLPVASKGVPLNLLQQIPFKMSTGVSGWVATNRKSVVIENAERDTRFSRAVDVITGVKTRSLLCVPIIRHEKVIGVVELVNRTDGVFREQDRLFLEHLSGQVGIAIENCSLYERMSDWTAYTDGVINSLTGGFLSVDPNGEIIQCNTTACRILDLQEENVLGKGFSAALPQYPVLSAIIEGTQKNQRSTQREEVQLPRSNGSTLILGYSTFLIRDKAGQIRGAGIIFQDLTYLRSQTHQPQAPPAAEPRQSFDSKRP